jgi:hypothetical protein
MLPDCRSIVDPAAREPQTQQGRSVWGSFSLVMLVAPFGVSNG